MRVERGEVEDGDGGEDVRVGECHDGEGGYGWEGVRVGSLRECEDGWV